ncbi:hypothetical protein [Gordonia jinghuaiqii]|uniref:Mce-associated membrane protein n=1 Tax=Gordonia jinghuaiqii TaxID=2758710 RepID=A0A7D7LU85_9ACTN|nr:hypothetical protein [Gordonia jinghuaiqii]QMT00755.1 hypothetical protein H1R19_17975 [Gordonia jinghuaiqii]
MTGVSETSTTRIELARARVDAARRAARTARIAAAPALRERALRRTRMLRVGLVAVAVVVAVLIVAAGVLFWQIRVQHDQQALENDVLASARDAVTVMLSADPADPAGYVDAVAGVSTGPQRERIDAAREALADAVRGQRGPSVGQLISAGLVRDPSSDEIGTSVEVLVVADATDPVLLGGSPDSGAAAGEVDATGERVTALITMTRTDAGWKISRAGRP